MLLIILCQCCSKGPTDSDHYLPSELVSTSSCLLVDKALCETPALLTVVWTLELIRNLKRGLCSDWLWDCQQVKDFLYLGGVNEAKDLKILRAIGVTNVLNCTGIWAFHSSPKYDIGWWQTMWSTFILIVSLITIESWLVIVPAAPQILLIGVQHITQLKCYKLSRSLNNYVLIIIQVLCDSLSQSLSSIPSNRHEAQVEIKPSCRIFRAQQAVRCFTWHGRVPAILHVEAWFVIHTCVCVWM